LTFSKQQYFIWDNTSQSTKPQEMLEMSATPRPADDLLGPCRRPGASGHHIGDTGHHIGDTWSVFMV